MAGAEYAMCTLHWLCDEDTMQGPTQEQNLDKNATMLHLQTQIGTIIIHIHHTLS